MKCASCSIAINTMMTLGLRDPRPDCSHHLHVWAGVGAVLHMKVEDNYVQGRRSWLQLKENGSKVHHVPCHHRLEEYLHEEIQQAGIADEVRGHLFRFRLQLDRHHADGKAAAPASGAIYAEYD